MAQTYPIIGIPLDPGATPRPRREINTWYNDPNSTYEVSLFIQAMNIFQRMDPQTHPQRELSYYRIAGIHGFPVKGWDGEPTSPSGNLYCSHGTVTFPTWHRPYLLLFEQRLYEIMMNDLVPNIPGGERATWTAAAKNWRLPYWDWAASYNAQALPALLTQQTLTIRMPGGASNPVPNPCFKFSNPSGRAMGDARMGDLRIARFRVGSGTFPSNFTIGTSRHGIPSNPGPINPQQPPAWTQGIVDSNAVRTEITNPGWDFQGSIQDYVYRLLSPDAMTSWEAFATTTNFDGTALDFMSLEDVHNYIHVALGGGGQVYGHMSFPPVSAFDPVFWLHHCNIDRLTAMFQAMYPQKWFDQPQPGDPSPNATLLPFHINRTRGRWTSTRTRDWTRFGYTYDTIPVTQPPPPPPFGTRRAVSTGKPAAESDNPGHSSERAEDISNASIGSFDLGGATDNNPEDEQPEDVPPPEFDSRVLDELKKTINETYGQTRRAVRDAPEISGHNNDYIINVVYDPYALNGIPYTIQFYLSYDNNSDPLPIGTVYTFTAPLERYEDDEGGCVNCEKQKGEGATRTAQVPITNVMLQHAKDERVPLENLERDVVQEYLKKRLGWRVVETCGGEVDVSTMPKTRICVMQGKVHNAQSDTELASFGDYEAMWEVTKDKVGGAGSDEDMRPA